MSKLTVRSRGLGRSIELNCLNFNSPIVASIGSSQTHRQMRHFPVKVNQPTIDFLVQFANEPDFEDFQDFVRKQHEDALINGRNPGVTLSWPERNIRNWTGIIKNFKAGGMRFNPSPRATFSVDLITSSVSGRSFKFSEAADWRTIFGFGSLFSEIELPTLAENIRDSEVFGSTIQEAADAFLRPPPTPIENIDNGNLGLPEGVLQQEGQPGQ